MGTSAHQWVIPPHQGLSHHPKMLKSPLPRRQFYSPPSDKKNYVSKMPQKQEKMSFKNVWKKNDKIKKTRPPP